MQAFRIALTLALVSLAFTSLQGESIVKHTGRRDPETEGWKKYRSFNDIETAPIKNDSGTKVDAWSINDTGRGDGIYGHAYRWSKAQNQKDPGWKLTVRIRIVQAPPDGNGAIMCGVLHNGRSYIMGFGKTTEGYPVVTLGREGTVTRVVLDDLDKGYHDYVLEFDPADNSAHLAVDGKVRSKNYSGLDEALHNVGDVYFGSTASEDTGKANYALVQFEEVRQP